MSSPPVAGSAALLVALHSDWTPGQIKSALMTTATTAVVKEDTTTPADPFDFGAGRIELTRAGDSGLTFDERARAFTRSATNVTTVMVSPAVQGATVDVESINVRLR